MLWVLIGLLILFYLIYNAGYYVYMYASHQLKKGNKEKAFYWFEFGYRYTRVTNYNKIMYAAMLLKDGQVDEASQKLNYILMNDKMKERERSYARAIQALVEYKRGDLDRAIEMTEELIQSGPNTFHYGNLGYLYIARGDLDKALSFNQMAYEYNDSDPIIADNLADTYLKRGELDEAGTIFEKLMPQKPQFPDAYYHYGQYLVQRGKPEEALASFQKALMFPFSAISPTSQEDVQREIDQISEKCPLQDKKASEN